MKKLKAIFLNRTQAGSDVVYRERQIRELSEIADIRSTVVTPEELATGDFSDVQAIFSTWGMVKLEDAQLDKLPNLKIVFYAAGATDFFARPLFQRGIKVVSAWRANGTPVAELTVAQIILSLKNYFTVSDRLHSREMWTRDGVGPGAYGETVAIIGDGAVANHVVKLLRNFKVEVIQIPAIPALRTIQFEEAFKRAYVVSNHLPNREDNRECLTKEMFASMRHGATFINTGRGAQVDQKGMIEVLKARPDLTALLDVTTPEPPEEDSELYKLPNVRLSPHIAGALNDETMRLADLMIEEYRRYVNGEALQHEVVEEMLMTH